MTYNHIPKYALLTERDLTRRIRKNYITGFIVGILPWLVLLAGIAVVAYIQAHPPVL